MTSLDESIRISSRQSARNSCASKGECGEVRVWSNLARRLDGPNPQRTSPGLKPAAPAQFAPAKRENQRVRSHPTTEFGFLAPLSLLHPSSSPSSKLYSQRRILSIRTPSRPTSTSTFGLTYSHG